MITDAATVRLLELEVTQRETKIGMTSRILANQAATAFLATGLPAVSLKTLYSDFVVRELSPFYNNGEPLVLKDEETTKIAGPADENALKRRREEDGGATLDDDEAKTNLGAQIAEAFGPLVSAEDLSLLVSGVAASEPKIFLRSVTEKEKRTLIHQAVKKVLGTTHVSGTVDGCVAVSQATKEERREQSRRSRGPRPRKFLHFTLYKENLDSTQVFRSMAAHLRVTTRQFQFCGTKDKRAVTLQRVAIRDLDATRLAVLNRRSFGFGTVRVSSFTEEDSGLKLGDALGNHFRIVLRPHPAVPCDWSDEQVRAIEGVLSTLGAINYFGTQRFGTTEILTSDVGLRLLRSDFRGAVEMIFASRACIAPCMKDVVPVVAEGRFSDASAMVPHFCFQERDILRHLVSNPADYNGAFRTVPRTLAMLYIHAVQSLIWNRMASRRLASTERAAPEVGDLVLEAVYQKRLEMKDATKPLSVWSFLKAVDEESGARDNALPPTRVFSADDDLALFALSDVLLPVPGPGRDLQFPQCAACTKEDYFAEATELGICDALLNPEATSPLIKILHYHGGYRPLCVRPERVRLSRVTVPSWRAPVVRTDLEELQEKLGQTVSRPAAGQAEANPVPVQAIVVELSLPPGCYATSVLREICSTVSENFHQPATAGAAAEEAEAEEDSGEETGNVEPGADEEPNN